VLVDCPLGAPDLDRALLVVAVAINFLILIYTKDIWVPVVAMAAAAPVAVAELRQQDLAVTPGLDALSYGTHSKWPKRVSISSGVKVSV
jgi:hypothetical protein